MCHGLLVQLQRLLVKKCHGCGSHHKAQPVPREECNMVQDAVSAVLEETNKTKHTHTQTDKQTNRREARDKPMAYRYASDSVRESEP